MSSTRVTDAPQLWEDRFSVRYRHPPERGVLLRACQKQRADIRAGGDEKALGGLIDLDDLIFFYAEAGADHQIQHSQRIFLFFHDDPPSSPIMRRMGENFPGKIRRFFHFSF